MLLTPMHAGKDTGTFLDDNQLQWLLAQAKKATAGGKRIMLFSHHQVCGGE